MWVLIEMVDSIRVKQRRAAADAMDFIAFFEKQLGKVSAILARDPSNNSLLHFVRP
jgi:hypothetical protein